MNDQKLTSDDGLTRLEIKVGRLEELAHQQGVSAVNDLDEISALWPADDDPDELLNHIITERNERRLLHHGHHGAE